LITLCPSVTSIFATRHIPSAPTDRGLPAVRRPVFSTVVVGASTHPMRIVSTMKTVFQDILVPVYVAPDSIEPDSVSVGAVPHADRRNSVHTARIDREDIGRGS
jgi:hypothetical protein